MIRIALFALWLVAVGLGHVSAQTFQSLGSASLAVTVASGRVALPAGSSGGNVTILNVGTDEAFINFGGATVTAATTNESVPSGSGRCFAITSQTYVAAITAANTATLRISQGSGPCALSYRGGSSTGVTAAAVLDDNQIVVGNGGARGVKTVTTGTNVLTALGNTAGGAGGFALVGSTPPTGAAGGDLASTYPNPTLAWINRSAAQTLNIGAGGTLGSNAFTSTGYMPLAGGTFTGGIGFSATNTLDIGTNATTLAPRTVYAGTSFIGPTGTFTTCAQVGGATCGANALAVTGTSLFTNTLTVTQATAAKGIFTSTGGSNTGSDATSAVDLSWTLNTSGSPDVFAMRVVDTARGGSTRLFNIYGGVSGTTSEFSVDRGGFAYMSGWQTPVSGNITATVGGNASGELAFSSAGRIAWTAGASALASTDAILTRAAAANIQLGAVTGSGAAVAQTLSVQGSSGNSAAAALFTIAGSDQSGTTTTGGEVRIRGGNGTSAGGAVTIYTSATTTPAVAASWAASGALTHAGGMTIGGGVILNGTGGMAIPSGKAYSFLSRSDIWSPSDGVLLFQNNADNDFGRLQFGGTTSSFPAIKRSAATLAVRLADDSADAGISMSTIAASGITTITNSTDASASSGSGSLQVSGGASVAKRFWLPAITTSAGLQTAVLCQSASGEVIADSVACLASSEKFKENIAPSDMGLATVLALRPITYRYRETGNARFDNAPNQRAVHAGFSAEQAAAVDPRLVAYDADGNIRTIRPDAVPAALVRAVQELKADNDNLRFEIETLKLARR